MARRVEREPACSRSRRRIEAAYEQLLDADGLRGADRDGQLHRAAAGRASVPSVLARVRELGDGAARDAVPVPLPRRATVLYAP